DGIEGIGGKAQRLSIGPDGGDDGDTRGEAAKRAAEAAGIEIHRGETASSNRNRTKDNTSGSAPVHRTLGSRSACRRNRRVQRSRFIGRRGGRSTAVVVSRVMTRRTCTPLRPGPTSQTIVEPSGASC